MARAVGPVEAEETTALPPLNPLQSSHSHMYGTGTKLQQLRQSDSDKNEKAKKRSSRQPSASTETGNIKRRSSRLGMFGLFNRHKAPDFDFGEGASLDAHSEVKEDEQDVQRNNSDVSTTIPHAFVPPDESFPAQEDSLRHRASRRALKTRHSFTRQKSATWDPPPLFQAYPQAVKHETLSSPVMSADTIVRLNLDRQNANAKQTACAEAPITGKKHKDKKLKKTYALDLASSRDWADKVFVLVTEGYLLQYTGQGCHDRLPEKILPLCKDSAAFVTDAISGRPFVLQISQISGDDGSINPEISKELLRKANLKNEVKRSATTILLVLTTPEAMNEWLVAVRKEIGALGGKEYKPDVFGTDGVQEGQSTEPHPPVHRAPSQRYLVKREPHRFTHKPQESPPPDPAPVEQNSDRGRPLAPKILSPSVNRYSLATQRSTNSRYMSDTTASIDQVHLDRLRESPRQSYISVDAKTASTSRCSSVERSPMLERFDQSLEARAASSRKNSAISFANHYPTEHRISETVNRDVDQATPTPTSPPGSSRATPTAIRAASPATPNFSVPTFSKRYSVVSGASAALEHASPSPKAAQIERFTDHLIRELPDRNSISQDRSTLASKRMSSATQATTRLSTPPKSSDSKNPPSSSGSEVNFSKRYSSLNYARGISPVPLPSHSPSPHPPPTTSLPPLPKASLHPPPATPSPPVSEQSSLPPPTAAAIIPRIMTPPPNQNRPLPPPPPPQTEVPVVEAVPARKLRRPISMQVRPRPPTPPNSHHASPAQSTPIRFPFQDKPKKQASSPSMAGGQPPPSSPTKSLDRKSMTGLGREPPPVPTSPLPTPMASMSVVAPTAEDESGEKASHPFIPPIKLSDRKSRGSLDGPWNADYAGGKRVYLDLSSG